jgi:prepilin-type N-terminal cleavage/methylation domain-containing protein
MPNPLQLRRRGRTARRRRGVTLVELAVVITVLTIALCATTNTVVTTSALNRQDHETEVARRAAEGMLETLRNTPLANVFKNYDSSTSDDPGGVGTAPGATFAVPGLTPVPGAPGGVAGQILFPGTGPTLREDVVDAQLGMPRDLNLDGLVDASDHAANYRVLPVRVRVTWRSASGRRTLELSTLLSEL